MGKTVDDYQDLPYRIELWRASEGGWITEMKELPGCVSQGETAEEALAMIRDAMQDWLEVALRRGSAIHEPRPEEEFRGEYVPAHAAVLHEPDASYAAGSEPRTLPAPGEDPDQDGPAVARPHPQIAACRHLRHPASQPHTVTSTE